VVYLTTFVTILNMGIEINSIPTKHYKELYDGLRIRMLTRQGIESDPAQQKHDNQKLDNYKKMIKKLEASILEIKLDLKN